MGKVRAILSCSECGQHASQWTGRCPGCGAWGSIEQRAASDAGRGIALHPSAAIETLGPGPVPDVPLSTGLPGVDRVLGGGLVPASVVLLAGEPGIGKSTLLLHLMANLSAAGLPCLLASGEESRAQVAARAVRLGLEGSAVSFVPGRELPSVVGAVLASRPSVLAVDSIQTLRDPDSPTIPGGPAQVRGCTDVLVGLAKSEGVTVIMTGHVTKEGDVAGPRTLEHAVDVVLSFEGDPRSGLRILSGGKNRFGAEGEVAWFDMSSTGLREADPAALLAPDAGEAGSATALPLAGRRAFALELQALAVPTDGPPRRHATGLDPRRFSLLAAVLDRLGGIPVGRMELYGATAGGVRASDPGCDLAVIAALASSATSTGPPKDTAFVGEVSLTGQVRPVPGMAQRAAAAVRAGVSTLYAAAPADAPMGVRVVPIRHVAEALKWAATR